MGRRLEKKFKPLFFWKTLISKTVKYVHKKRNSTMKCCIINLKKGRFLKKDVFPMP